MMTTAGDAGAGEGPTVEGGAVGHVAVDIDRSVVTADQQEQVGNGSGCRICQLGDGDLPAESGSGQLVRLGCGCRGEIAAAHRRCAEAWFSVRGNRKMAPPPPLDEDVEDPLEEAICDQRIRLSEEEVCNLWDIILPRADIVGVPFVTRLTSTMVDRHVMKLPKSLSVSCGIEPDEEGSAGIRLTTTGSVTTCAYGADTDGRTYLSSVGWKSFLVDNNLHVGQAILITIRNTHRQGLRMMIVIDII